MPLPALSMPPVHPRVCGELLGHRHDQQRDRRFIPACAGNSRPPRRFRCAGTVHPRVCGELTVTVLPLFDTAGSSPRVRGTPENVDPQASALRFIPACAGNSVPRVVSWRTLTVHPRVCGELGIYLCGMAYCVGSSPRVRGTHHRRGIVARRRRFIPACAGNSSGWTGRPCAAPVHPRVCGELGGRAQRSAFAAGSSPRVRGTQDRPQVPHQQGRFIPACAGNSSRGPRPADEYPVHPRVCGELNGVAVILWWEDGSSPRVRGTRSLLPLPIRPLRFIPACAGNSVTGAFCSRMRAGSSPRVRGTPQGAWFPPVPCRFIPACAGNSRRLDVARRRRAVHPRVCGELPASQLGSRGSWRFIPACAGNS